MLEFIHRLAVKIPPKGDFIYKTKGVLLII